MKYETDILLIEDSTHDAELAIRALQKNNLVNNLVHLKNGAEALDYIFAEGKYADRNILNLPKMILLDLKMPKIGGIEVLKRLKSDERTKRIPVVILTSSKEDPDINICYDLGANSYIVKPVEFDDFVKAVSNLGLYWMILNQPPV
jgi:two-component system response regulator